MKGVAPFLQLDVVAIEKGAFESPTIAVDHLICNTQVFQVVIKYLYRRYFYYASLSLCMVKNAREWYFYSVLNVRNPFFCREESLHSCIQ